MGRCSDCASSAHCGFCVSTLQCLEGGSSGPVDGTPCPHWSYDSSMCPAVPQCPDFDSCAKCASQDQCAWCASDNTCTTVSEAFSRECRGLVFELPCPVTYTPDNVIVGNLVVEGDPTFGGGELNVTGKFCLSILKLVCL
jgi:hypothetical protein